ncbi:WhiB family transcriptional regulator [Streptomyces sp. NBC_01240]|uniref:WhiB family transcriptional regulator n=1 Tax=Streptomyces sp. NBC_01240 TaxID=2903793 RepID=UPI002E11F411|nr:WhiB family transcriptional regulator [Streptomyces sp. NBC_01240]
MTDSIAARQQLVDDRHYKYRGCAPDEDDPTVSAADPDVSLDAWGPYTGDGAEPQKDRFDRERTAKAVCGRCPVLALCRTYANTTTVDADGVEHLVEPEGVQGGELALTRHRALIARRHAVTVGTAPAAEEAPAAAVVRDLSEGRTPQKRAVLKALARETDTELVAYRAGMDVRTANWHRSALVTMLGLDKERATRDQLLAAAVDQGLLPRSTRIRPDGPWAYAAAPTTDGARQRRIAPGRPIQLILPGLEDMPRTRRAPVRPGRPPTGRGPASTPRRRAGLRRRLAAVRAALQSRIPFAPTPVLEPAA